MAVHCDIKFEKEFYYPGELLKGTIELDLAEPQKFRGFYYIVYGSAKCRWNESHRVGKQTVTSHYKGEEVYLDTITYLFGYEGAPKVKLPSGIHRYNFEYQLPINIPASFESEFGYIRYTVDIPHINKVGFTVVRNDNVSLHRELMVPSTSEEIKTFCCLFCISESFIMTVTVPKTGFASGETIPITINYVNQSAMEIQSTKIDLERSIVCTSHTPTHKTKVKTDKMVEKYLHGVDGGKTINLVKQLTIPHKLTHSNDDYCSVVRISYQLKVEANISRHSNVKLIIPITIGAQNMSELQTIFLSKSFEA